MNNENFNKNLREALRQSAMESAPAAGWEQRVLDDVMHVQPSRRKFLRTWLTAAGAAAAAAVLILITLLKPQPAEVAPVPIEIVEIQLLISQAPAPIEHIAPQAPQTAKPTAQPRAISQPVLILPDLPPEELAQNDHESFAPADETISEFIDDLLAQGSANEREILTLLIDPNFNASYIPLQDE